METELPKKLAAKKSLGQHFLHDQNAIADILMAARIRVGDKVLEIGPGTGILTDSLLKAGAHVLAYEKDDRAIPILKDKFATQIKSGQLNIIHGDYLESDTSDIIGTKHSYKIVANIPYYITGAIMQKALEATVQPELMVLMVQKEVADRIVAIDGKHSILSLSVWLFGEPGIIRYVPAESFSPPPKVDSAIILIDKINNDFFNKIQGSNPVSPNLSQVYEKVFKIIHTGFAHKRKFLFSNLSSLTDFANFTRLSDELSGMNPKIRPEDLSVGDWKTLILTLYKNM